MEAIVFSSTPGLATQIRSADDLVEGFVAEPLVVSSPRVFAALAEAAGLPGASALAPLRDATCQSFPVWTMAPALSACFAGLPDEALDDLVLRWRSGLEKEAIDADPYELATWLAELQAELRETRDDAESLFVLFEEKAMA